MSKQIITDYMAGQIGDEYYEILEGKPEYIGVVSGINKEDKDLHYFLANNYHVRGLSNVKYFDHFEREVPDTEPADDDMERITDIKQVRPGDIEVTKSGNWYKVVENDSTAGILKLKIHAIELGDYEPWIDDAHFAYALRPKPKVPTEPGLYFDSDKDVWEINDNGERWLLRQNGYYTNIFFGFKELDPAFAPYTRIDLEADHE